MIFDRLFDRITYQDVYDTLHQAEWKRGANILQEIEGRKGI